MKTTKRTVIRAVIVIASALLAVIPAMGQTNGRMLAVFNKHTEQVAWLKNKNLFDLKLRWIGFLNDGNFFDSQTSDWLGPFHKGTLLDQTGKPVAWIEGSEPEGTLEPLEPLTPLKPLKPLTPLEPLAPLPPLKPLPPLGGWSHMQWRQWIAQ